MTRRGWTLIAVTAVALGGIIIAARDTSAPSDFSTTNQPSGIGVVVGIGDGWTLETYEEPGRCYLLRINGATTYCQSTELGPDSSTWQVVDGEGHRLAVLVYGSDEPVTGRWFSSSQRAAPLAAFQVGPDHVAFVVDLEPGEDPWGIQVVDETGATIATTSFVR